MKLISWNVNGLRAAVTKGFIDSFNELDADIFCLQETKLQPHQIELELPGYEQFWNSAVKKGYSGTAVFTRIKPIAVTNGIGIEEHDQEGRVITAEYDNFYLVCCYTPNSQRELARLDYRMTWEDAFRAYLLELDKKKPVILCGDLNVAHNEIDLKNPKTNRKNAGFSDEERAKMTELLDLVLPIHSVICILMRLMNIAGGPTWARLAIETWDGELTTLLHLNAWTTKLKRQKSINKSLVVITVQWNSILNYNM